VADTSLIFSIIARDRTSSTLDRIRRNAASTGSIAARALGPAIAPVVASSTGAIIGMGAALAGAGVAAGVFGGVVATSMVQVTEAATKVEDLNEKVELYGRQAQIMAARGEDNTDMLKKQAKAALELEARLSLLSPPMREATREYLGMKTAWNNFAAANEPATFGFLARGYRLVGQAIGQLQPFYDMGAAAANRLLDAISPLITGGGLGRFAAVSGPALASLTQIIINTGTAIGGMASKFVGTGQGVLDWIEEATRKWAEWSTATEANSGINKFVDYISTNGPRAMALLSNIAQAAITVSQGIAPLAPISMAVASGIAALIAVMPPELITTIVSAWLAFNIALKAWAVAQAIATAAQWAHNAAMLASPVTWIVLAIAALVAVIVLVATKTRFFQTVWQAVWGFMKGVGAWFAGPFAGFFISMWAKITASLTRARGQFMSVVNFIKNLFLGWVRVNISVANRIISTFTNVVNFFRRAPGRISGALRGMFNGLWSGFRGVVNNIIGGWNRLQFTIGGGSFAGISIPSVSFGTPNIPYLDRGAGMVMQTGVAMIHRGEQVTPAARVTPYRSSSEGKGGATITIKGDGSKVVNVLIELLREGIRDRGGDPVKVLTAR
jgi:hypothetical protein